MNLVLLMVYLVLITPVKLGAAVSIGGGPGEAAVGVMIWGWKRILHIRVRRQGGVPRLCADVGGRSVALRPPSGKRWDGKAARTLLRGLAGRGLLRLTTLDGLIRIGGRDAGWTALLTGGIRAALALLPNAHVQCVPAFGGETILRLRCIASARLGTIGTAGLMAALGARRTGRKEEGAWIIPSDS